MKQNSSKRQCANQSKVEIVRLLMFPLALVVLPERVKDSRVIGYSFHFPIHVSQEIHSDNVRLVEQTHPEAEIICFCCLIWTQADQTILDICGVDERRIHCLSQR